MTDQEKALLKEIIEFKIKPHLKHLDEHHYIILEGKDKILALGEHRYIVAHDAVWCDYDFSKNLFGVKPIYDLDLNVFTRLFVERVIGKFHLFLWDNHFRNVSTIKEVGEASVMGINVILKESDFETTELEKIKELFGKYEDRENVYGIDYLMYKFN